MTFYWHPREPRADLAECRTLFALEHQPSKDPRLQRWGLQHDFGEEYLQVWGVRWETSAHDSWQVHAVRLGGDTQNPRPIPLWAMPIYATPRFWRPGEMLCIDYDVDAPRGPIAIVRSAFHPNSDARQARYRMDYRR